MCVHRSTPTHMHEIGIAGAFSGGMSRARPKIRAFGRFNLADSEGLWSRTSGPLHGSHAFAVTTCLREVRIEGVGH